MIVIATNNGMAFLPKLLDSFSKYGTAGHKVCIVDTGSTDPVYIDYINSLDKDAYIIMKTPYRGYDTGAYIWAYRNTNESEYLFMHDSMEVVDSGWVEEFSTHGDVCAYSFFKLNYFDFQFNHFKDVGIYNPNTTVGMAGPIFYIKRPILDLLDAQFNLDKVIPDCKWNQSGMELGWYMMFATMNIHVHNLYYLTGDHSCSVNEFNPKLQKRAALRN